jgi:ATP-dependent DNA helicase
MATEQAALQAAKGRVNKALRRLRTLRERRKNKRKMTEAELKASMDNLDKGLKEIENFGRHLMKNSAVLGKVGTGLDGQALGDHQLSLAEQPESMTGGTMKDYQLEGLTWMLQVALQEQCGILADEMGLGKFVIDALCGCNVNWISR